MDIVEFFEKGGPLMWPILATSVVGLGLFIAKMWETKQSRVIPLDLLKKVRHYLENNDYEKAEAECAGSSAPIASIFRVGFQAKDMERTIIKEKLTEVGQIEMGILARWSQVIGICATVGPLLGLLGTVTGMLKVFMDLSQYENPAIAVLARGIYEALITTVAGLPVGIMCSVFHAIVQGRLDRISARMEEEAIWLMDKLSQEKERNKKRT